MGIVGNFGNQISLSTSKTKRGPRKGFRCFPGALARLVLRGVVARLSHLPKSETDCDVTPPGDAEPGAVSMTITPKNGRQIGS